MKLGFNLSSQLDRKWRLQRFPRSGWGLIHKAIVNRQLGYNPNLGLGLFVIWNCFKEMIG